jgi:hypothetical protein
MLLIESNINKYGQIEERFYIELYNCYFPQSNEIIKREHSLFGKYAVSYAKGNPSIEVF